MEGHEIGAGKVEDLIEWIKELEINETTLYCFSLENFKRSKKEVSFIMKLFKNYFSRMEDDPRLEKDNVKIRFAGNLELLNPELRKMLERIERKTKDNKKFSINFALAYGGRQEIIHSIRQMVKKGEKINEANLARNLWISENVDLIIRTGNEKRMSNFLPWQSVYSEWVFLEKMWPEIKKEDIENAVKEFQKRERRFGR